MSSRGSKQPREDMQIPKIIHFVYGLKQDFGGKPFSFIHWAAIKSAIKLNPGYRFIFWYSFLPGNHYFEDIKSSLELKKINPPVQIYGNELCHVAHQADIVRLRALNEIGGIYLDIDTVSAQNFDQILDNDFVMGIESTGGQKIGLCNAVMAAKPRSTFGKRWLDQYKTFRSKGRDEYWNEHSVKLPSQLADQYPDEITVLPNESFFYPSWSKEDLASMFIENNSFPKAIVHHLWENKCWRALQSFNENNILLGESTYAQIIRDLLNEEVKILSETRLSFIADELSGRGAKLNLGCGSKRLDGYINCDIFKESGADIIFDMTQGSWPIPSNSINEAVISRSLEHLRGDLQVFFSELYRVSCDGALIKISVPHPRHDYFLTDPTHIRSWLPESFLFLDKKVCTQWFMNGDAKTPLALYWGIDFELDKSSSNIKYDSQSVAKIQQILGRKVSPSILATHHNNIISDVNIVLRARK